MSLYKENPEVVSNTPVQNRDLKSSDRTTLEDNVLILSFLYVRL